MPTDWLLCCFFERTTQFTYTLNEFKNAELNTALEFVDTITNYLSLLTMLADSSLLEMLFSGLDGPPLDMALRLPVMLDCPLQPTDSMILKMK